MYYVINEQISLTQQPEGPFKSNLGKFADILTQQGYARKSTHYRILIAARFSGWVEQQGIKQSCVATDHCQQYLHYRTQHQKARSDDRFILIQFLNFLRNENAIPVEILPEQKLNAIQQCAQSYEQYLYEVRGLTKATVINYVPFVCSFLEDRFGVGSVRLSSLRSSDVVKFVQCQAPRLHKKRAKLMTSALRSFFQYTCSSGKTSVDLVGAVPIVANWSMPSIPRGIQTDQVSQLLAKIDQKTAAGCREYAIFILIARLGLRLSEVTFLELGDIDWNIGSLNVLGKGGRRHVFPLSQEVGGAIATYLRNGRPTSSCRRVFLRTKAPIQGFRSITGISSIIRRALVRYGIESPTYGAHQFRHSLATEMLRQGASLGEIGDVLGHRSPETTKIYTKVDIEALRSLAPAWPGGVQ